MGGAGGPLSWTPTSDALPYGRRTRGVRMKRTTGMLAAATLVAGLGTAVVSQPTMALAADEIKVVPLQVTGPPSERLNLIILGDGYQADEMEKFRADVDRNQNVQWASEPFRSYRNYFNVYRV